MDRNPDNLSISDVLVFRVDASLLYFNVEHVRDALWAKIRSTPGTLRLVVYDMSSSPFIDLAGVRMLECLYEELLAVGIRLRPVAAHATVRDILRAESLEEHLGDFDRRLCVADVIDEFQGKNVTAVASPDLPESA